MKKLFVVAILLMCAITVAVLSAGKAFRQIDEDGYAVPASAEVAQLLAGGGGKAISLTHVQYDDVVYQHINGYYVGQQRAKIDITYPLYTHGGSGVRFLDEENWLITPEVNVYRTFDGLYLSDGVSYNSDMSQADEGEEFIFLSLTNGLYMNAQQATLSSPQGERVIPANSILSLTENAVRWMEQRGGTLGYDSEENLFDATLTIGSHTYSYSRLLDALGLIKKAIEAGGGGQPDPGILDKAEETLNTPANEKGPGSASKPLVSVGEMGPDNQHGLGENTSQAGTENGDDIQQGEEAPAEDNPTGEDKPSDGDKNDGNSQEKNPNKGNAGAAGGGESAGSEENNGTDVTDAPGEEADDTEDGSGDGDNGDADSGADGGSDGSSGGSSGSGGGSSGGSSGSGGGSNGGDNGNSGGGGGDSGGSSGDAMPSSQTAKLTLRARKRLNGEPAKESLFLFQLKDSERNVIQEKENDGDRVVFDPIELSEEGTFTYYIQEEEDIDPGFYYDTTEYRAEVTVAKNERDKLEVTVVYYNNETNTKISGIPVIQNGEVDDSEFFEQTGDEEGSGAFTPAPYRDPVVTLTDFNLWSYAADMTLTVDDPSGAIQKGVKIAVYKELKQKPKNHDGATQQGNVWVWPADYEGTSLTMRQTKTRTQSFALAPLQPGGTYYIQYTYRYDEKVPVYEVEKDEDGNDKADENGDPVYKKDEDGNYIQAVGADEVALFKSIRHYVTSPLVEITLPGLSDDTIKFVNAGWNTTYAAASDGLQLTGLTMRNSSDYIPDGSFNFELVDADGNVIQSKGNTAGLVSFDKLSFQQAGVYSYRIVQKRADMDGVACDDAVYEAVITVRASKATKRLVAFVSYRKNGVLSGAPAFVNTISADGVGTDGGDISQYPASSEATGPDGTSSEGLRAARVALTAGVTLDGKLTSGSGYDWENFKKNILPYADRLELTLKPEGGGEEVTVAAGASVLNNAARGTALFKTSGSVLEPNKRYTYTAVLKDRYGNDIPMRIAEGENDSKDYEVFRGTVYTQKRVPVATITETANETSSLTLKIKISDPDGALAKDENGALRSLRFTMGYSDGAGGTVYSDLDGTLGTGVSHPMENLTEGEPREKEKILLLEDPEHNKEYTITLTSLAFSRLFEVKVEGSYSPQPDFTGTPETLEERTGVFGKLNVYTARISDGLIGFTSSFSDLMDTSVTVNLKMANTTTLDILALVDEFRISLVDADGNKVNLNAGADGEKMWEVVLKKSELSGATTEGMYDEGDSTVTLIDGYYVTPTVKLYGTEDQWTNAGSPWEAFCIRQIGNDATKPSYSTPMELRVSLPKNTLKTNTVYKLSVEPVVIKSGEEYPVPVRLTNTSFTTKKLKPEINYALLAIADKITFSKLTITDPEGTILNDGEVRVELRDYNNSGILISSQTIKVKQTPIDITFDGIITGARYIVQFVASRYNDTNNPGIEHPDEILEMLSPVVGSSGINGTLDLTTLKKEDGKDTFVAEVAVAANDVAGLLGKEGEKTEVTLILERSLTMEQPDYKVIETIKLPLEPAGEGSSALTLTTTQTFSELPANDAYRVTLTASYSGYNDGEAITLAQITFRTSSNAVYVSTHKELYDALRKNSSANILVTADFELDPSLGYSNVYGVVDFQGHRVWQKTEDGNPVAYKYSLLRVQAGGVVKNLVYDFAQSSRTVNAVPVFDGIYGTVENLIVRTHSPVEITGQALVASGVSGMGTLRNFIVSFEDDIRLNSGHVVCNSNYMSGRIEDGYIYSKNNAGILGASQSGSFVVGKVGYGGYTKHIYVASNYWSWTGANNIVFGNNCTDSYISGDYYSITPFTGKDWNTRLSTLKTGGGSTIWAITQYSYSASTGPTHALQSQLWNVDWQKSVLGDGFEVDNSVSAGFYPRLKLSPEMQKYQEYLPLPKPSYSKTPVLVEDSWADDNHTLSSGLVKLRFQNGDGRMITSVEIDGLKVALTGRQEPVTSHDSLRGLVDVYAQVTVDPSSNGKYLSAYKVTKFSYAVGANATWDVTNPNYTTKNIEFWKEVSSENGWAAINDHMNWNYKLTEDIDLGKLNPGDIVINGTRTLDGKTAFTGKLDGQEHVVSGISLINVQSPWLIYELGAAGVVRNLFVEGMTISGNGAQIVSRGGLIGASSGTLENVRLKNCSITAGGNIGLLIGYGGGRATDCSAADCTLTDKDTGAPVYAGGLVGYNNPTMLRCYTRNVRMDITHSSAILGVGGLLGWRNGGAAFNDCYAHGRITAAGSNVGGIYGFHTTGDNSTSKNHISYVNIRQTSGDYVGGLTGKGAHFSNSVVLGDITGAGEHVYRGVNNNDTIYYYQNQLVSPDPAVQSALKVLTDEMLVSPEAWLDVVRIGDEWYCGDMDGKYMPKLRSDCERPEWKQENIPLPGSAQDPSLTVDRALYDVTSGEYTIVAVLNHPGMGHGALMALEGDNSLTVTVDGLDFTPVISSQTGSENGEATLISITAKERDFTRAYDNYALTVMYNDGVQRELVVTVAFREAEDAPTLRRWIEVYNLDDWSNVVDEHADTNENVRINVLLDFNGGKLTGENLQFNRLVGKDETCGFINAVFEGDDPLAPPWVKKISASVETIRFENCTFNFAPATSRSRTGAFGTVSGADHVTLENVRINANRFCGGLGFFSEVIGSVSNVTMKNVSVIKSEEARATDVAGTLVGVINTGGLIGPRGGTVTETDFGVKAENIVVDCPRSNTVGGIIGSEAVLMTHSGITVTGLHVNGVSTVGGVVGNGYSTNRLMTVTGKDEPARVDKNYALNVVNGGNSVGGIGGYLYGSNTVTVKDMNITGTGNVGGASGTGNGTSSSLIMGCTIEGRSLVGGYCGGDMGNGAVSNTQIVDCTVINTSTTFTNAASVGAGGYAAKSTTSNSHTLQGIVIRNTKISGPTSVGGVIGWCTNSGDGTTTFKNIYVAEDVTVTATGKTIPATKDTAAYTDKTTPATAGGLIGYCSKVNIQDVICGAEVKSASKEAGGLLGHIEPDSFGSLSSKIMRAAYVGDVEAHNYAGGLVGLLNGTSSTMQFTSDTLQNSVVAANVTLIGSGEDRKKSAWINFGSGSLDAGTGSLYVFQGSALTEGEDTTAVWEAYNSLSTDTEKSTSSLIPKQQLGTRLWATTENLSTADWYTGTLNWPTAEWDLTHLGTGNQFMPYVRNSTGTAPRPVLQYANHAADGTAAGIEIPQYEDAAAMFLRADVHELYVSGVDTLTAEGFPELTINGETLTADEDGLITFTWDFSSDLYVYDYALPWADYARTIMIWGDHWYVIDGGALHYGSARGSSAEEMAEAGTVAGIGTPIHLWQGKVLTADGKVYSLSGGTASGAAAARSSGQQVGAAPIYRNGGTEVYYGFTRVNGARVDGYRVFQMNGAGPRAVALAEDAVYDGIVLNSTGSIVLRDGELVSSMTLDLAGAYSGGIDQISNSFGYDGTALLLRYDGGGVKGVDYANGFEFFSTSPQSGFAAFAGYVKSAVKSLMSPIFGSGQDGLVAPEQSLVESEQLQNALGNREPGTAMGLGGDKTPSSADEGSGPESGSADEIVGDVPGGPGDGFAGEPDAGESNGDAEGSEPGGENAVEGAGEDGIGGTAGSGEQPQDADNKAPSGEPGELTGEPGELTGEIGELTGETGELTGETGELTGETGELTGETGELTGETGELTGETGELTGETGELTGETGDLTGETGELTGGTGGPTDTGKDPAESAGKGGTSSGENAKPGTDAVGNAAEQETSEERLVKLFGDSVVLYSEETGKYELFATETMLSGDPVGYEEMLARRSGEKPSGAETAAQDENQESHFAVTGWGFGRSLDAAEKQGFALLAVASGIAFVGLAVLCTTIRRRKK